MKNPVIHVPSVLMCLLLCLLLPLTGACALEIGEPLTGVCYYPEGAAAEDANYAYYYAYPRMQGEDGAALAINEHYAYEAYYIDSFDVLVKGRMYDDGHEGMYTTTVTGEITLLNDRYLSVRLLSVYDVGAVSVYQAGNTFTLTGAAAGTTVTLPVVLGVLAQDESDEWLRDRQTAKCDDCVRALVWEEAQRRVRKGSLVLYEEADEELLADSFYPEDDYYLNAEGNLVFFIQPGFLCDASYGVLEFEFSVADVLDEL